MDKETKIIWTLTIVGLMIIFSTFAYADWKNYEEELWFSGKVINNEFVEDEIGYMFVSFNGNKSYKIIPDNLHQFRIGDNYSQVILYREPNGEHPDLWRIMATFYAPIFLDFDLNKTMWEVDLDK